MIFMPRANSGCVFLMKYVLSFTLWNFEMVISLSLCLVSKDVELIISAIVSMNSA